MSPIMANGVGPASSVPENPAPAPVPAAPRDPCSPRPGRATSSRMRTHFRSCLLPRPRRSAPVHRRHPLRHPSRPWRRGLRGAPDRSDTGTGRGLGHRSRLGLRYVVVLRSAVLLEDPASGLAISRIEGIRNLPQFLMTALAPGNGPLFGCHRSARGCGRGNLPGPAWNGHLPTVERIDELRQRRAAPDPPGVEALR